jgi:hypothetical protein
VLSSCTPLVIRSVHCVFVYMSEMISYCCFWGCDAQTQAAAVWMFYILPQGKSEERAQVAGRGCKYRAVERECGPEPQAHGSHGNGHPQRQQRRRANWTEVFAEVRARRRTLHAAALNTSDLGFRYRVK